jgi:hypothetical protein
VKQIRSTNMNPLSSTITPHRLYTFRCNGTARWMAVPYPPQFPSPQAQAQMLRTLFQKLEAEFPGTNGCGMNLSQLNYVDQIMPFGENEELAAGPERAASRIA